MKRLRWVAQRLERWQAWSFKVGRLSSPQGRLDEVAASSRARPDILTKVDFDSLEVEMAVCELEFDLKAAVLAYYLWPEKASMDVLAGRLGISRCQFHDRLCRADIALAHWFEDHRAERFLY